MILALDLSSTSTGDHISTAPTYDEGNRYVGNEPHGMCVCPDARHDDWECPRCRRPSFSPERIAALRGRR